MSCEFDNTLVFFLYVLKSMLDKPHFFLVAISVTLIIHSLNFTQYVMPLLVRRLSKRYSGRFRKLPIFWKTDASSW